MEQQIPITKYDKPKAKSLFVLFKAAELFGVFLLTFGFYGLGSVVYKYFPELYKLNGPIGASCISYPCVWFRGFITFFSGIIVLGFAVCIGYVVFVIIKAWIKANWNLAKRFAEDSDAKAKRLKEKNKLLLINNIKKRKRDREIYGCCEGDEVEIIGKRSNHFGEKGEIMCIDRDGYVKVKFRNHSHLYIQRNIKITKKIPLTKSKTKIGGEK